MVSRTHLGMDTLLKLNHIYVHGFKDPCGHGHNSQLLKLNPTHAHIYLNNVTPSTFFYWKRILTNSLLNYIIFIYSLCLKNFKSIKDQ